MHKNPYPNEHAIRYKTPKKDAKYRRQNNKFGQGVHAIWMFAKYMPAQLQAIRLDAKRFTKQQARQIAKHFSSSFGTPKKIEYATNKNPVISHGKKVLPFRKQLGKMAWFIGIGKSGLSTFRATHIGAADFLEYEKIFGPFYKKPSGKKMLGELANKLITKKNYKQLQNNPKKRGFDIDGACDEDSTVCQSETELDPSEDFFSMGSIGRDVRRKKR